MVRPRPINRTRDEWEAREWWPAPFIVSHDKRYWHVPLIEPQLHYDLSASYSFNACGRDGNYKHCHSIRRRGTEAKPRAGRMCRGCIAALKQYYEWEEE